MCTVTRQVDFAVLKDIEKAPGKWVPTPRKGSKAKAKAKAKARQQSKGNDKGKGKDKGSSGAGKDKGKGEATAIVGAGGGGAGGGGAPELKMDKKNVHSRAYHNACAVHLRAGVAKVDMS